MQHHQSAPGQQQPPQHSDNVDEELHRIHLALTAVFSPQPALSAQANQQQWWQQRQSADAYLTSFQTTKVSWMVCDRLLSLQDAVDDVAVQQQRRFFAAQTLHLKCRVAIEELPRESLPSLRDSLLTHLQTYTNASQSAAAGNNTALTTRLAMCVAALAVQMNWTTVLTDLFEPLQKNTGDDNAMAVQRAVVLSILQVLPEECASDRLLLEDETNRYVMRDHFVSSSGLVFDFLNSCLMQHLPQQQQQVSQKTIQQVLSTLHLWIRYVPVEPGNIGQSPLLAASIQALSQPAYIDHAADVVVEILRMYPSHHPNNEPIVQAMLPLLFQHMPLQAALQSDNEDVWKAYCRVVTEMGESYMSLILSSQAAAPDNLPQKMVEWVLLCSKIPETEIANITLHFWYRMVMDLESIDPYEWRQELIDLYTPHLLQLIDICVMHLMKYPEDMDELPGDRMDDLHRDRFYVAETIEDCCRLLGGQLVLQRIGALFHQECQRVQQQQSSSSGSSANNPIQWHGLESCFACIQCMHRFVPSDEAEILPFCFNLIPQLPPDIPPLRFTASKTIGKYASWLVAHPNLLQPLLPYLANGLKVPHSAPAAAVAIKELCENSDQRLALGEPVLQLYNEITANAHDVNNPTKLELADELQILEGVCRALSKQMHDANDDGTATIARIVQPIGSRFAAQVADPKATPKTIIPEIERLTTVVQHLSMPTNGNEATHPVAALMQSSWALIDTAAQRFPQDIHLAEKICRLHKHSLRSCGARAYEPLINPLMEFLVVSYQRSHLSPFLYAASICAAEYGRNPAYSQKLLEMVSAMAQTSFSFLKTLDDLTHHPDVVEEFFYLMGRMVTFCPDPMVTSTLLQPLLQCAAVGMQVAHRDANKGTLSFLDNTISYGLRLREQPPRPVCQAALEHALTQEGQTIVTNLARALMGELPNYGNQVPELMWKLNLLCPEHLAGWLTTAFTTAMNPPERAKAGFMGALNRGLPRDDFNLAVRAFVSACERERKTQQRT
ncbi:Transportin-3 [Seminavis robusta]|uniref:Transportin-3 n=1 Tax=Seminavis robusta TaxID=568900 RepID=A0A9N8HMV8_9STRA|nr:Transportin-3 [Seminavis robusta]|eukprot:Sro1153_g247070.1 Transportin-3 (1010) ;mRNA; r:26820-29849